jgi:uncharacterized protein YraI
MIRFCLACALSLAAGAAAAHPAMTATPSTMREAPSPRAHVVQHIPAHAQIDLGECRERWCAASWRNLDGYVRVETVAISEEGPVVDAPPPYRYYGGPYYGGPVVVGPVVGFGYYYHSHW